ncbi:sodium-coupled monocarboxylate transporter 2 [Halyomorpha halys]|uniref:sodium-coupled monocarboxylate transporter 2 n=1 Tax=Halyomorpha halys TaxID=286706 RepID=UPI0006D4E992|nr:sodium-coupled monocarboxylate transporter 2-like [Halyomorpha halys]XP_014279126.1 sodium-coupled monocarboxylate transporter 2-like [Halyomorpha halys]XP_014279127.1 sodium-coupled monocarboxylate transporter 2-like [Halyomorpha halys]
MPAVVFDWIEYTTFFLVLGISSFIGVFFGFIKTDGQNTVNGYLLGGKKMGLFPVSISLVSSFTSGNTILGTPAEVYTYGTQYLLATICFVIVGFLCAYVFLPVFYKLQLLSLYEYMELRFNKFVRNVVSFLYTFSLLIYIPIVIYGPAIALNQASNFDVYTIAIVVCTVCIFYTTFGGLKAVVWSDTIQGLIMVLSAVIVAVIGTIKVGGVAKVFEAASEGERLEFFRMDIDPRVRLSFWTIVIGITFTWTGSGTISPSAIQRFISLRTMREAKIAVLNFKIGCFILFFLSGYMGLVIYATYKTCDPKTSGMISRSDQILPFFILDVAGNVKGLAGLFLAGVVCAALSTMSTGLNTVAGTLYEDFIQPTFGKTTDARAATIMKMLSAAFGFVCLALVVVVAKLGSLVEISVGLGGVTNGAILGVFILGLFFPQANSKGAAAGGMAGLLSMGVTTFGSRTAVAAGYLVHPIKPTSIDNCDFNITINSANLWTPSAASGNVFPLFEVSLFYYGFMGCIISVTVGLFVSYFTGPNKVADVNRDLLSPLIYPFLPKYSDVPLKEKESEIL